MAKTLKETLLGTLVHGEEIMEDIRITRKVSLDKLPLGKAPEIIVPQLHASALSLVVSAIEDTGKNAKVFRLSSETG